MNHRFWPVIAAVAGLAPVGASAEKQGQIGSRSQASISINVSVAPRFAVRGREMMEANSGRPPAMCLVSNMPPESFTMIALPASGGASQASVGDAWRAAASRSSVECGPGRSVKADLAMSALSAPGAVIEGQPDPGPLVLIIRPE